jgi:hypothetical protein
VRRAPLLALAALTATGCSSADFAPDARRIDAPLDAAPAIDAAPDAPPDAAVDAAPCPINAGHSPTLDGTEDLFAYPASQRITPGFRLNSGDQVAITWDRLELYVTVVSASFVGAFKPAHVYLETGAAPLPAPSPTTGKEYGNNIPALPFAATHLIAIRRQDDSGSGPYDGVYAPSATWTTRTFALVPGTHVFVSADGLTLSARVPWAALGGCPTTMRLVAHVVHGEPANEWKDTVPTSHTPWIGPAGGGHYRVDLTADPAVTGWVSEP